MLFPCLAIFILFLLVLAYFRHRGSQQETEAQSKFWEKEIQANATRRQDLSNLDYIHIPEDIYRTPAADDSELLALTQKLSALSQQKIVNLSGLSNTDLKLAYGVANFPLLTEYDENYTTLICTLVQLGKKLIDFALTEDAIRILSFGVSCQSDIAENYTLLADLYKQTGNSGELSALYSRIQLLPEEAGTRILSKMP